MKTSIISRFALISFIVVLLLIVDHVDAKWGVSRTEVPLPSHRWFSSSPEVFPRGGDQSPVSTDFDTTPSSSSTVDSGADEPSLDEKVYAAMQKLGMSPPTNEDIDEGECKDGVCSMADQDSQDPSTASAMTQSSQDPHVIADSIAQDMNVDSRLAMAAIGATSTFGEENQRIYNDQAARDMIQYELDLIESIPSDSPNVQKLVEEGFDLFFSRRALAFAENNMDDARAILLADQMDEDEDDAADAEKSEEAVKTLDMVEVKADFDPTALPTTPKATPSVTDTPSASAPKPAPKESVVFEATTAQIQELVLESPVPVLLDIYADWCG